MLSERVKEWTKDWKQQGIEEGIEQGIEKGIEKGRLMGLQQGESTFLLYLLEQRFGSVNDAIRDRIESADTQMLLIWGKRVLTAQTVDEVFSGAD